MKTLTKIYAHLSCSSLRSASPWFEALWGREPDDRPMDGLAEWHHGSASGFQLFENPEDAGHGNLTLFVDDLEAEHAKLADAGLSPSPIEPGGPSRLSRLRDPDGNLVVLVQAVRDGE